MYFQKENKLSDKKYKTYISMNVCFCVFPATFQRLNIFIWSYFTDNLAMISPVPLFTMFVSRLCTKSYEFQKPRVWMWYWLYCS